jgi:N-methylhydantoinase B
MTSKDVRDAYGIDLATAEALRGGFMEVTRHMHRTLQRSAFSNVVRELLDFGVCVHLPSEDGIELVAVTEGCTHFAFTEAHMTNFVIDEWGLENLGPGDTLICNDPWRGAIHMPDVNLFRPVFWEGELIFVLSDAAHLLDIGGPVPGGFNNAAQDFFSEGLRIPPMLIMSGDQPVRSTMNLILENSRTPMQNLGDLRALFGTMKVGESRLHRLLERYGAEAVKKASRYTVDLADRRMRNAVAAVPDGVYEAEEWIDDDGLGTEPVRVNLRGTVKGRHIELDFTGTDRQPLGALTTCWEEASRVLIGAKMILDPDHPMNAGAMRAFDIVSPPGTVVMGIPPTSNSQHAEVATAIASLSLQLFSKMVPERAVGEDGGTSNSNIFGGIDQRPGREGAPFGFVVIGGLGWGGNAGADGISFCTTPLFGVSSPTFELMERDAPMILRGLNAQIDAAGAGEFRSGYQTALALEASGPMSWSAVFDSGRFTRSGTAGGGGGMTSYGYRVRKDEGGGIPMSNGVVPLDHLTPLIGRFAEDGGPDPVDGEWGRGTEHMTAKVTNIPLDPGDVLLLVPASGGGYGDPLGRDPALVQRDVWNELVSVAGAAAYYGVVVDPETLELDAEATKRKRAELREAWQDGGPPISMLRPWPRTTAEMEELGA